MFYFTLVCHVFTLLCGVLGAVFIIIYTKDFYEMAGSVFAGIFIVGMMIAFFFLIVLSLRTIFMLTKDYKCLRSKEYITITGKVIGFERNRDPESGVQINNKPIIVTLDTENNSNSVTLVINNRVSVGKTYKIHYLKHSKIAEIIDP